jgi:Transposase IS116/IS110/IS902 family
LMALRGISLLAAVTVVAELGDLARFASAPQRMAYLGLVPSEHSSGKRERRGGISKTGNSHVRRVLIEAAWTYRHAARKTAILQRRAERTPPEGPGDRMVGAKAAMSALSKPDGARQAQEPGLYRHCARARRLYLGYRATRRPPQPRLAGMRC